MRAKPSIEWAHFEAYYAHLNSIRWDANFSHVISYVRSSVRVAFHARNLHIPVWRPNQETPKQQSINIQVCRLQSVGTHLCRVRITDEFDVMKISMIEWTLNISVLGFQSIKADLVDFYFLLGQIPWSVYVRHINVCILSFLKIFQRTDQA